MIRHSRRPVTALTATISLCVAVFFTLYSLIPLTADPGQSSLPMGTMMAFVMGVQVFTPTLVRRLSLRTVIAGSAGLLPLGALIISLASGLPQLLAGAVFAGSGFGLVIVAGVQGIAILTEPEQLGKALSVFGLVTVGSTALGAPIGLQFALAFPPIVFGLCAVGLGMLGILLTFRIPAAAGKDTFDPHVGNDVRESPSARANTSSRLRAFVAGAPWLVLCLMLIAMTLFSHGISSLPAISSAYVNAALVVFTVQAGNAVGRGLGGPAEQHLGQSGALLVGATIFAVGGILGVVTSSTVSTLVAGGLIGVGVGIVQTVSLHIAMRRMEAGRASVIWNLMVDGGLWLGGVFWGIALATGIVASGAIIFSAAAIITGAVAALRLRPGRT